MMSWYLSMLRDEEVEEEIAMDCVKEDKRVKEIDCKLTADRIELKKVW